MKTHTPITDRMRKMFILLSAAAIGFAGMTSCQEELTLNSEFKIDSSEATYDAATKTFNFSGERTTATIEVVTEDANGRWDARCPTDDLWCTFSKKAGSLIVTVAENATDMVRESHITIVLDGNESTVGIRQEYIRNLDFVSSQINVGASSGTYKIGLETNVRPENLEFSVLDENGEPAREDFWLSAGELSEDMVLSYSVTKNRSETEERSGIISVKGEGVESSFRIIQNMASGKPYIIPLDELDFGFEECLSYEIWDEANNVKIGNICREYLLKGTPGDISVDEVAVVAYPMLKGEPDHSNGYVIATIDPESGNVTADGGSLMWNSDISASTGGYSMISARHSGELSSLPDVIYIPFGGNAFTADELDAEDVEYAITASVRPWTVTDTREGEEISGRGTSDEFTYRVVKVGCQYWFAENLKTTRFKDGTPIPTGSDNWKAAVLESGPVCASAGYTANGTSYSNANANGTSDAAVAVRNETGPVYNFFALFNRTNDVSGEFTGPFTDALAPEGWAVPTSDEFRILHSYITQTSEKPDSDPCLALVMPSVHETTATNLTGFGATCYRYRSASGTNSSNGIHYAISDAYSFSGPDSEGVTDVDSHSTVAFCCGIDANTNFRPADIRWGIYVRCIKR